MALTAAERQKRYRERLKQQNPQKYEQIRIKHLQKVKQNAKKIADMSEKEKEKQRKKWKTANDKRAAKKQNKDNRVGTQSSSILDVVCKNIIKKRRSKYLEVLAKNEVLMRQVASLKRKNYRYKNEIIRLKSLLPVKNNPNQAEHTEFTINDASPMTKTNIFLNETLPSISNEAKAKVKKNLLLLNTLTTSLKKEYHYANTNEKRNVLKNIVSNDTVKMYKLKTQLSHSLGLKGRIRKVTKKRLSNKYKKQIHDFFLRDDVSRATAGKHECKTKNKNKVQKRYLLDTMLKLHAKYRTEGGKASYVTFVRYKPFFVMTPRTENRNTCACIRHSNIAFKALKLKKLGVLKTTNLKDLLTEITCKESYECMYSKCDTCKEKKLAMNIININEDTPVQWIEWKLRSHTYQKHNKNRTETKTIKKYTKEVVVNNIGTLITNFSKELERFKKHFYNLNHQYKQYRKCIENLEEDEVAIVCDFSENFVCKHAEEIQAVHFGSSRNQITLHTSVLYTKNGKPMPICSISAVNDHDPGAIWAHMDPIMKYCKTELSAKVIHIFSDGPSTQYKQKKNFFMFMKQIQDYKFQYGTWNYFEAAHGKGAADGVGGAIKRKLDQHIAYGNDITNAKEAYDFLLHNINVKIYYIQENDIRTMQNMIPNNIIPLKGTMDVHQIITNGTPVLNHRHLSCFDCAKKEPHCTHFEMKQHNILKKVIVKSLSLGEPPTKKVKLVKQTKTDMSSRNVNNKVTLLSDVKLTNQNKKFYKHLPLQLQKIDKTFDICSKKHNNVNVNINVYGGLSSDEDKESATQNNIIKKIAEENKKPVKRNRRSLSSATTSESREISVHSDSDLNDIVSDSDTSYNSRNHVCQVHNSEPDILVQFNETIKNTVSENFSCGAIGEVNQSQESAEQQKLQVIADSENDYLFYEELEEEYMQDDNKEGTLLKIDQLEEELHLKNDKIQIRETEEEILTKMCNREEDIQIYDTQIEPEMGSDEGEVAKQYSSEIEEDAIFNINDTVLTRYYIGQSWKYYVGIIKHINVAETLYSISFFKTIGKQDKLKFRKPIREDMDTVPKDLIVKHIKILQISEKPVEYVLYCDEDVIYF